MTSKFQKKTLTKQREKIPSEKGAGETEESRTDKGRRESARRKLGKTHRAKKNSNRGSIKKEEKRRVGKESLPPGVGLEKKLPEREEIQRFTGRENARGEKER